MSSSVRDEVPLFGPMVKSMELSDPRTLRDLVLTKMINGTHAAFHNGSERVPQRAARG
jgi:hypothetical protein